MQKYKNYTFKNKLTDPMLKTILLFESSESSFKLDLIMDRFPPQGSYLRNSLGGKAISEFLSPNKCGRILPISEGFGVGLAKVQNTKS